ncbi:sugar transferase [Phycicoccus sp. CSK15P-2]|uniref:sugar transferase n=1 Tax=Phycicoccus sp. CSK15P-2 TaxID=2807627 RepID=UPI0019518E0C|nr:sugar transferase [Phycicoccus sp. CSK15P-2]MBM6404321.1 sugar transferase [Phycicoccus sp. CSK15P-2]
MTVHELLAPRLADRTARWNRRVPVVGAVVVDAVVIVLVTLGAALGRMRLPFFAETGDVDNLLAIVFVPIVLGWVVSIALHGGYASHVLGAGPQEYKQVLRATLVAAGATGVVSFLAKFQFSRGFFFLLIILGIPALLVGRHLLRRTVHAMRRRGHLGHRVLLAGSVAQVEEIAAVLRRERWLGYEVVGALVPPAYVGTALTGDFPVLGSTARITAVVRDTDCDIVLFGGGGADSAQEMRRAAWELDGSDVQIMLVPSLTDVATDRVRVRPAAGLHLMELEGPRAHRASRASKRAFDIVGATFGLVVASPVLLLTALAVFWHDRGPVFFRQSRVGRHGDVFECLKFRSMVVDADRMVDAVATENKHGEDHVLFKAEHDTRITGPGRLIRRLSIDETPQFLNVLRGEMSLVGPRPPLPQEVERYSEDVRTRLAVRPGMTGLWQVSGRADLSWEDSVRLDLYYVDNWSIVQDLGILWRTVSAVVGGRGAY